MFWWIAANPRKTLVLAGLLTVVAVISASGLTLRTSRRALLPRDEAVTRRLDRFLEDFGAASDLVVVIEGSTENVRKEFARDLQQRLEGQREVRSAIAKLDLEFLYRHAYVFIPPSGLRSVQSFLRTLEGAKFLERIDGAPGALDELSDWLDSGPDLLTTNVSAEAASEALRLTSYLLDEWLRFLGDQKVPDDLDWERLVQHHEGGDFLRASGFFTSREHSMYFVFVRPWDTSEEFGPIKRFVTAVRRTADELAHEYKRTGRRPPRVGLTGLPAIVYEEYQALRRDIRMVLGTALVLVLLVLLLAVRSIRWAVVVFVPMALGTVWNLGLARLTVGHLNMSNSTFTAILFGLGVDYGIFMSSRIMEGLRSGEPLLQAVAQGASASVKGVLGASLASVLIFGAIGTVRFTGYAELGIVASTGVLTVIAATLVCVPAIFVLLPVRPKATLAADTSVPRWSGPAEKGMARWIASAVVILAVAAALVGAYAGSRLPFDYDPLNLLPKGSEAALLQRKMVQKSDYQPEVIIFTASDMEEARRIVSQARGEPTLSRVQSVVDLFPLDGERRAKEARSVAKALLRTELPAAIDRARGWKLAKADVRRLSGVMERLGETLEDLQDQALSAGHGELVARMDDVLQKMRRVRLLLDKSPVRAAERTTAFFEKMLAVADKAVKIVSEWTTAVPLIPAALPRALSERFFGKDGRIAVYAFPKYSVYNASHLDRTMKDVYDVSKEATGFPTTHQVFSRLAVESFWRGTLYAWAITLIWMVLVFRNALQVVLALVPLFIGVGWMGGVLATTEASYNYASIIGVPLVMALAIDYGVWFSHRAGELSHLSPWQVALVASRAVGLAAATTLAGLGAIALGSYKGVASMGVNVIAGLLCCLTAALLVAPAIQQLFERRAS